MYKQNECIDYIGIFGVTNSIRHNNESKELWKYLLNVHRCVFSFVIFSIGNFLSNLNKFNSKTYFTEYIALTFLAILFGIVHTYCRSAWVHFHFKVQVINNQKFMLQICLSFFYRLLQTCKFLSHTPKRRVELVVRNSVGMSIGIEWLVESQYHEAVATEKIQYSQLKREKKSKNKNPFIRRVKKEKKDFNGKNVKYLCLGVVSVCVFWTNEIFHCFSRFNVFSVDASVETKGIYGMCKESNKACSWHKGQFVSYCASITRRRMHST